MKTMLVKAKPGLRIPYPENSYRYLEEKDGPTPVDISSYPQLEYWTRRVDHGECDQVRPETMTPATKPSDLGAKQGA